MKVCFIATVIAAVALASCDNGQSYKTMDIETYRESVPSLSSILDEKKAAFEQKASAEKKRIYGEGIEAVRKSGVLESAMNEGDHAPDFEWTDADGEVIRLYDYLKKGPVVLTWYRGGWCPYCNLTLHRLQEDLPMYEAAGAHVIALAPERPDSSLSTKNKQELEFEVLSDEGNRVARTYGIVYKLTNDVAASYQAGFDLHGYNGDESNELPLAATYVIDKQGVIRYAFLDAEYRNRAEPADILEALNRIREEKN
jgi:peroxiredoxin